MKIQFNFEKKHFYIFLVVFAVFAGLIYVKGLASSVPPTPWHPLQEVATGSSGITSVDIDANGVIDNADNVQTSQNTLAIQGQGVYWIGLGGASPQLCFDQGGSCGSLASTSCTAGPTTGILVNADSCADADCPSYCRTVTASGCDGNAYSQCSGGTQAKYQTGVCTNPGGNCAASKCFCDCSNPQPTYLRETLVGAGRKCSTFISS